MQSLTLEQVFGGGASQNANNLIIQKSSLLRLTPQINNTPESLLAAILITAIANFQGIITDENNQAIIDENNQAIEFDNSEMFELLKIIDWEPFQSTRDGQKYINNQIIIFSYAPN
ncbi:MAG TPA: hypothetical protein VE944_32900 [Nostoc sp.]|uniref:hypothetical protein n=1 Tax=Nostoc sp. TaxID=1180 RepID=UPI002D4443EC|nr:hypothetical protein [Nostoc sp.]HYX19068.1 hypothetical protein [Nostoc sp.]